MLCETGKSFEILGNIYYDTYGCTTMLSFCDFAFLVHGKEDLKHLSCHISITEGIYNSDTGNVRCRCVFFWR